MRSAALIWPNGGTVVASRRAEIIPWYLRVKAGVMEYFGLVQVINSMVLGFGMVRPLERFPEFPRGPEASPKKVTWPRWRVPFNLTHIGGPRSPQKRDLGFGWDRNPLGHFQLIINPQISQMVPAPRRVWVSRAILAISESAPVPPKTSSRGEALFFPRFSPTGETPVIHNEGAPLNYIVGVTARLSSKASSLEKIPRGGHLIISVAVNEEFLPRRVWYSLTEVFPRGAPVFRPT